VNAIQAFTATVTVTDALGRKATASGTATGTNNAPGPVTLQLPGSVTVKSTITGLVYSTDPDGDGLTCKCGVGGDCASVGCACIVGEQLNVQGGNVTGVCTIKATACDPFGACSSATGQVNIMQ
jgi:hypothetical protein